MDSTATPAAAEGARPNVESIRDALHRMLHHLAQRVVRQLHDDQQAKAANAQSTSLDASHLPPRAPH